jgi:protein TonB
MQDVDAKMPLAEGEVHTNDSANQLEKAAAAPRQAPSVALGADRDDVQRYLAALMRQLHRYKSYPSALKRDKVEGHVVVQFTLNAGGQIVASRVERSSGHAGLDQAALQMLARANPLPAIPDSMNRTELTLSVPVEYSLITDR